MGEMFEVSELVRIAVEDERTGVAFYSALAGKAESPELQETYAELSRMERVHQQHFEEMLQALGDHKAPEQYSGEYSSYLHTLTGDRAFPDEATAIQMANDCADDLAALDLATRFELDTVLLMHEMRKMVPERHRPIVDELIGEEQDHVVVLAQARLSLSG